MENYNVKKSFEILSFKKHFDIIQKSGLFNNKYYLNKNEDIKKKYDDPLKHWIKWGYQELRRNPSRNFSNKFYQTRYLSNNYVGNPLTHYIVYGEDKGYKMNTFGISYYILSHQSIKQVFKTFSSKISIIMPLICKDKLDENILNLLKNTFIPYELILLNINNIDLSEYDSLNIKIVSNHENLKFADLLNKVVKSCQNDIVLLNQFCIVTKNWLESLVISAYSDEKIDVITPISNSLLSSSEILNKLTIDEFSVLIDRTAENNLLNFPFSDGFCLYIKNKSIKKICVDENDFNYSEEYSSFLIRISSNLNSKLDQKTFVHHEYENFINDNKTILESFSNDNLLFFNFEKYKHSNNIQNIINGINTSYSYLDKRIFLDKILLVCNEDELLNNKEYFVVTYDQYDMFILTFNGLTLKLWKDFELIKSFKPIDNPSDLLNNISNLLFSIYPDLVHIYDKSEFHVMFEKICTYLNMSFKNISKIDKIEDKDIVPFYLNELTHENKIRLIENSGLFNKEEYLSSYVDVSEKSVEPIEHWVSGAYKEFRRNPSKNFSNEFYRKKYLINYPQYDALLHYITIGKRKNYQINLFEENISNHNKKQILKVLDGLKTIKNIVIIVFSLNSLKKCLEKLLKYTENENYNIFLLNFKKISLKSIQDIDKIQILDYEDDLFNSLNHVLESFKGDLIFLNSFCYVTPHWLKHLTLSAYLTDADTVTPIINKGIHIDSNQKNGVYTEEGISVIVKKISDSIYPSTKYNHGYCIYIKDVENNTFNFNLSETIFDSQNFLLYLDNSLKNIIDDSTILLNDSSFINHLNKHNFRKNYLKIDKKTVKNPIEDILENIELGLNHTDLKILSDLILIIVEKEKYEYVNNLILKINENIFDVYILTIDNTDYQLWKNQDLIKEWHYEKNIFLENNVFKLLMNIIFTLKIDIIHYYNYSKDLFNMLEYLKIFGIKIIYDLSVSNISPKDIITNSKFFINNSGSFDKLIINSNQKESISDIYEEDFSKIINSSIILNMPNLKRMDSGDLSNINLDYLKIYSSISESSQKMIVKETITNKSFSKKTIQFQDFMEYMVYAYYDEFIHAPFSSEEKCCINKMFGIASDLRKNIGTYQPLISVIMPTYNRAKIIKSAISSVLNQTYANFELIIVDDKSTDETKKVLKEFEKNKKIKTIFLNENKGPSYARNKGLKISEGEIITYLDSDNLWDSEYLKTMVGAFNTLHDADALYSGQKLYHKKNEKPFSIRFGAYNKAKLHQTNFIDLNCFCHKRKVYEEIGGFDENLKRLVDWDYILKISNYYKIYSIPVLLSDYYYNSVPNRISNDFLKNNIKRLSNVYYQNYIIQKNKFIETETTLNKRVTIIILDKYGISELKECLQSIFKFKNKKVDLNIVSNNPIFKIKKCLSDFQESDNINLINKEGENLSILLKDAFRGVKNQDILLLDSNTTFSFESLVSLQNNAYTIDNCAITIPQQIICTVSKNSNKYEMCRHVFEKEIATTENIDNIKNIPIFFDGEKIELKHVPNYCMFIKNEIILKMCNEELLHPFAGFISDYVQNVLGKKIFYIANAKAYTINNSLKKSDYRVSINDILIN